MEGPLFNYKMSLKNCISHIISMKYIMNNVTGGFYLSNRVSSSLPNFTCIPESMKVSSRGDSQGHCSESYQLLPNTISGV
ncbi:hypothetical protein AMTRI_Chr03g143740 [Amborella trichopoda]